MVKVLMMMETVQWALLMKQPQFMYHHLQKYPCTTTKGSNDITNQDTATYKNGYDLDGQLSYFDHIADVSDDPDTYNEDPISITSPPN